MYDSIRPVFVLMAVGAAIIVAPAASEAEDRDNAASSLVRIEDLQDQLEKGLKVRLPNEFAFIKRVVIMVKADELPLEMVMSTFQWARRKRPYMFPYFERGLRERAAKVGIEI